VKLSNVTAIKQVWYHVYFSTASQTSS